MSVMPGFPHKGFPEGWFSIGWSSDFAVGKVNARHYFGRELAVFRTETGRLVVTAGFCPHMGAKLAVGGRVEGECVVCPFHAWRWNPEGHNTAIPYASKPVAQARIKTYHTREIAGIVWMWYSWRSEEPTMDPPALDFLSGDEFFWDEAASRREWLNVRFVPQMVAENIVDGPHIQFVHGAADGGHIARIDDSTKNFVIDVDQTFRTRKGPILGKTVNTSIGVATQVSDMQFGKYRVVNVLSTIPIDEGHSDMRASIFIRLPDDMERPKTAAGLPSKMQQLILSHLDSQEDDIPIWENQIYLARPILVAEEVLGHRRFRKWAEQFYEGKRTDFNNDVPLQIAS